MRQVQDALAGTGIPTFALTWHPTHGNPRTPDRYIVYSTMTVESDFRDDDKEYDKVYVYLSLFSKPDPTDAIASVRTAMKAGGFEMSSMKDLYQEDTGYYLVSFTFVTWV